MAGGADDGRPRRPPLFGIAGYKNAGKTTLIVELIREITGRGWRVGTLKHAHHSFDIDHEGKDSDLHRKAGALEVVIASARRLAYIRELQDRPEPSLDQLTRLIVDVDLILVEGWKGGDHPRLELRRAAAQTAERVPGVLAIVSDRPEVVADVELAVPVIPRDDVAAIADFILRTVGLRQ